MFKIKNPIHASKVHKHQKIMSIIKFGFLMQKHNSHWLTFLPHG